MIESALARDTHSRAFEVEIKKFGEIVMSEPRYMAMLEETTDPNSFISTYIKLAAEKGIYFTAADMKIVVQEQKHGTNWVLPKAVLNIVRERF